MAALARDVAEKMELIQKKCAETIFDEDTRQGVLR